MVKVVDQSLRYLSPAKYETGIKLLMPQPLWNITSNKEAHCNQKLHPTFAILLLIFLIQRIKFKVISVRDTVLASRNSAIYSKW